MKKQYEDYQTYDIEINPDDETGIQFISVVGSPAIEEQGIFLSESEEVELDFKSFSDQMIIAGPTMIANKLIKQYDEVRGKHFVKFRPDVIKMMVEKFMKNNSNNAINFEHSGQMVKAFIRDAFIIEDPIFNNARKYGFNKLPIGSHFIVLKIEDKKFWNEQVKNGKHSFSIEGLMKSIPMKYSISESEDMEFRKTPPLHQNCECQILDKQWITGPDTCDLCLSAKDKWESKHKFSIDEIEDTKFIKMYLDVFGVDVPNPKDDESIEDYLKRIKHIK